MYDVPKAPPHIILGGSFLQGFMEKLHYHKTFILGGSNAKLAFFFKRFSFSFWEKKNLYLYVMIKKSLFAFFNIRISMIETFSFRSSKVHNLFVYKKKFQNLIFFIIFLTLSKCTEIKYFEITLSDIIF